MRAHWNCYWTFACEDEKEALDGDILELLPNYIDIDFINRIYVGTWSANYDTLWKVIHSQREGTGHAQKPAGENC